jgi:multiple sugar transport system permease protein
MSKTRASMTALPAAARPRERTRPRKHPLQLSHVILHLILAAGGVFMLLPFVWMISTSLKAQGDVFLFPPKWIPSPIMWSNYVQSWTLKPMGLAFFNSIKISLIDTIGTVFTSSMAAFAFAKLQFRGRNVLFFMVLATLLIPVEVTLIPVFILFKRINWIDTHWPLIVPAVLTNAYGVFLLRQFFMGLPDELGDAATIDGCNPFQIYWFIYLPLSGPALVTLGIFAFMFHWNEFLLPLIYLNSQARFTLPLMLASFQNGYTTEWALLMAAATTALVPVIIIYLFGQRYFVRGIALTGLKG